MRKINNNEVIEALRSCLPYGVIGLHEPTFAGNEWKYVQECLDTGWVSSAGEFVGRFEKELAGFTGVKKAVAVVNGTSALHIALKLAGVQPNDEVLVPDLTFVATANAITYCGAIPHFVDSEEKTLGVDQNKLRIWLNQISKPRNGECFNSLTGRRIKALIVMHTFGHPVDLDPLLALCLEFDLELIEDAAESLGSYYKGSHTGNRGRLAILSFNGNKIVTTGGGGAILTNDEELAARAKHITTTAKVPHPWKYDHDQVGYNYRLPNINAALGCAQLEQLPDFLRRKRQLAECYRTAFELIEGIRFFCEPEFAKSNYWLNVLLLNEGNEKERDRLLELTAQNGIMTRPVWSLMHKLPMFKTYPCMEVNTAESIEARAINIPSSAFLGY
ncbi:MAG: aminotransferase DegT [Desulfosporosinus sp. BRH_c37]|nr:MAG: aminotransferase DegT [Desulfosporosinus sp. BRH_c37]